MGKHLMAQFKSESLRNYSAKRRTFTFCGVQIRINHEHHNEYSVLVPGNVEIFRIIDHGAGNIALLEV